MEAKLREYRTRRRRQEFVEKTAEKLEYTKRHFVNLLRKMIKINIDEVEETPPAFKEVPVQGHIKKKTQLEIDHRKDNRIKREKDEEQSLIELDSETTEEEVSDESPPWVLRHIIMKWSIYAVIWLTLYFYFITLQFGAVFFAISLLIFIYINTGTRPKKKGEVSAYSVFNENCESIDGTVTAEKLQKEMFFGSFRLF